MTTMKIINLIAAACLLLTPVQATLRGVDGLYDEAEAPLVAQTEGVAKIEAEVPAAEVR